MIINNSSNILITIIKVTIRQLKYDEVLTEFFPSIRKNC